MISRRSIGGRPRLAFAGNRGSNQLPLSVGQVAGIMRAHRYGSVFLDLITQGAES